MKFDRIEDILEGKSKEKVKMGGWVYNKRSSGGVQFLILRDGTGFIQATVKKDDIDKKTFDDIDRLTQESSLILEGTVRKDKRAPGGYEIKIKDIKIINLAEEYPLGKKEHGVDFLMNHRHLWIRSPRQTAILKIRATVIKATRDFLDNNGFVLVDSPILTPTCCEETTTLFETEYFDTKAYLSQSGQLYNEAAIAVFGKVYCFGPTFRAEKSKTRRHLTEFWMVEPEMAFADLEDVMKLEQELTMCIIKNVLENRRKELETLERDIKFLEKIKSPFPRITYDECVKILQKVGSDIKWGEDFGADDEDILSRRFDTPFFVHRYPAACTAFYMEPDPENSNLSLSADLMGPEGFGEIIGGGSQRIHDLKLLEKRIKKFDVPRQAYEWYIDLRKYGSVPHSGFGMGIERMVAWICKLKHIRESVPFPRLINRIYP